MPKIYIVTFFVSTIVGVVVTLMQPQFILEMQRRAQKKEILTLDL